MGEEEKKPGEEEKKKMEEKKPAEEEKKDEKSPPTAASEEAKKLEETKEESSPPPPPPQEIVLKVYMHCEGCARKVRRCLKGFHGVEDVITDCKSGKVVVKGEKADPLKVLERVQRKSHRQVELISPIPKPLCEEEKKAEEQKEKPKPDEKKEEPQVIKVVLNVYMHCEACAIEIKKRIQRMKGVESAEPDLKTSQVTVKGVFDPQELVDYVYKRTGKHAVIAKQESEKKKQEQEKGEESKADNNKGAEGNEKEKKGGGGEQGGKEKKESGGGGGGGGDEGKEEAEAATKTTTEEEEETKVVEVKKNEYSYYPPRYDMEMYAYPPQIFSDENPNACSVM